MRACRLIRVEAPLYLALSASSPFLMATQAGITPPAGDSSPNPYVPLFESHAHHIQWVEAQLAAGTMQNVRHQVSVSKWRSPSLRAQSPELRICDLVTDPIALLAISLLEARLWQLIEDPRLDLSKVPLVNPFKRPDRPTAANEAAVAQQSLNAQLRHWQDGRSILARD